MNLIIALSGAPGVGKDTTADIIQQMFPDRFKRIRFAQPLIDMVKVIDPDFENYDNREFKSKTSKPIWWFRDDEILIRPTNREVLNVVANKMKAINPRIFAEKCLDDYMYQKQDLIVSDLRYEVENEVLDRMFNHKVLRIYLHRDTGDKSDYSFDTDLYEEDFDYVLDCTSASDLVNELLEILKNEDNSYKES